MSMLAIPVPENISELLRDIKVGGKQLCDDKSDHITVMYFSEMSMNDTLKIIPIIDELTKKQKPFIISIKKYTTFVKGKNGFPVICKIKNANLMNLRKDIKKSFDKNDIEYDNKFLEYIPHVTLEYNEEEVKDKEFDEISWQVNKISLYCGDKDKDQIYIEFPFGNLKKYSSSFIERLSEHYLKLSDDEL